MTRHAVSDTRRVRHACSAGNGSGLAVSVHVDTAAGTAATLPCMDAAHRLACLLSGRVHCAQLTCTANVSALLLIGNGRKRLDFVRLRDYTQGFPGFDGAALS